MLEDGFEEGEKEVEIGRFGIMDMVKEELSVVGVRRGRRD